MTTATAPRASAADPPTRGLPTTGPEFGLSEDQELVRDTVRRFAEERIRPGTRERDQKHEFPAAIVREMADLGLLGMLVPEEYGGGGVDVLTYLLAVEEVARACPSTARR